MLQVSKQVSDLIFSPGRPPQVQVYGQMIPVQVPGFTVLTPDGKVSRYLYGVEYPLRDDGRYANDHCGRGRWNSVRSEKGGIVIDQVHHPVSATNLHLAVSR